MEQKNFKRTTVTAALPYANGGVHIGHLAGVYVPADIYVRYLRLKKQDVIFIGGSDEHGVPITIRARKEGITPKDVVDRYHSLIKKSFEDFGISFDIYSRTTSETHRHFASDFFRSSMPTESSPKKKPNNITTKRRISFLPTGILWANARIATTIMLMATSASVAEAIFRRWNSSIHIPRSAVRNPLSRKRRIGISR